VSFVPLWEFNLIADVMNKFHSLVVLMDAILGLVLAQASAYAVTPLQTGSPSNASEATSTPTLGDIAGPPAADHRATSLEWTDVPGILTRIHAPEFPERNFDVIT